MRKPALYQFLTLLMLGIVGRIPAQTALPSAVNSGQADQIAFIDPSGNTLFLNRTGHPRNLGSNNEPDIWQSSRQADGSWAKAINAGAPINSQEADYFAGVTVFKQQLYVFHPQQQALLAYQKKGRFWQQPQPQIIEDQETAGTPIQYLVSHENRILLGVYERNGQSDIFLSFARSDNQWSPPQALPAEVNSTASEIGIFLAADQRSLYFASDRKGGAGGFDLYRSERQDESWSKWSAAQALGPAINTEADEYFLSTPASGNPAYFSRRANARAQVWQTTLPPEHQPSPMLLLKGRVQFADQAAPLPPPTSIQLAPQKSGNAYNIANTNETGYFQVILPPETEGSLIAEAPGYFPVSQPLPNTPATPQDIDTDYALASLSDQPVYQERNAVIEELQLYLQDLDEELLELQRQRELARAEMQQKATLQYELLSDPEIEALRHKYNYFLLEAEQLLPDTVKLPEGGYDRQAATEREVADMKARFRRYYVREKSRQQAEQQMEEGDEILWEEAPTFEELRDQAKRELEQELQPVIARSYAKGISVQERENAVPQLTQEEREALKQKQQQLREQIASGFEQPRQSQQPKPEQWTVKTVPAKTPLWEQRLRADLKDAMREEVSESMKDQAQQELQTFAEKDLAYRNAKLRQIAAEQKLKEQMQLQVKMEQQYQKPESQEAIAPLVPSARDATPPPAGTTTKDLLLIPAEVGRSIPLNNVTFESNQTVMRPQSYAELKRVLQFLNENEQLIIEVGAHLQGAISHANALQLTQDRAKTVANFLIGNGVSPDRVQHRGYGKAFPVSGQSYAQRVEMRIIGRLSP